MSAIATEQAKAVGARCERAGLYVHVPFCASTCDFCAFYQTTPTAAAVRQFLATIARERELLEWPDAIDTVFWGGGTPGMLAPAQLTQLAEALRPALRRPPQEWTVELAPGSVTAERLQVLRDIGVTRVSLGVQSFRADLLAALGRGHGPAQIGRAYDRVRAAGFASVNLDLMFALPGQAEADWAADLRTAIDLEPDHISTYCLTFEEDTALWVKLAQGRVKRDPAREAALYESTWAQLAAAGFAQYEISNFARPGHACRHNLATWRMGSWIGLGPSAASQYAGWRGTNVADTAAWADGVAAGRRATEDRLRLSPEQLAEDALVFGLRLNAGVDVAAWQAAAPGYAWPEVDALFRRLAADGLMEPAAAGWRLTPRGRLLADAVAAEILLAGERTPVPA